MTTRKVCKNCKIFVKGETCPVCKGNQFSTNWRGRIHILNKEKSEIAKRIEAKEKGEYAIRVR